MVIEARSIRVMTSTRTCTYTVVNNADVALQRWRRRWWGFARFLGGRRRRTSRPAIAVVAVVVVYEEQAGAHGNGQKHGCSMALQDMT